MLFRNLSEPEELRFRFNRQLTVVTPVPSPSVISAPPSAMNGAESLRTPKSFPAIAARRSPDRVGLCFVFPHPLKLKSMAITSPRRHAKIGAMSRIQMSLTGAPITVAFRQFANSRRASRKVGPRGASTRTDLYRENCLHDLAQLALDLADDIAPLPVNGPRHPTTGMRLPFGGNTSNHFLVFTDNFYWC